MSSRNSHRLVLATTLLGIAGSLQAQSARYSIDRPTAHFPDAQQSWGVDIKNDGTAVGSYRADDWKRTKGFIYKERVFTKAVLPQPYNSAVQPPMPSTDLQRHVRITAINHSRTVLGDALPVPPAGPSVGFFTVITTRSPYPTLHKAVTLLTAWTSDVSSWDPASSDPQLIVGHGSVAGTNPTNATFRGFAQPFDPDIGPLSSPPLAVIPSFGGPRQQSQATAVNRSLLVVGWAENADNYRHAFTWDYKTTHMTDLGTLGGPSSAAWDVNDVGDVVGEADVAPGVSHAFVYRAGVMQDLGTLGGASSVARGIADLRGEVVGWSWTDQGAVHAFLWNGSALIDLNTLIPPDSGWCLQYAEAINAGGMIVGTGRYRGETHAFVLTPIP